MSDKGKMFALFLASGVLDCIFVVGWVWCQHIGHVLIQGAHIGALNDTVLLVFEATFALGTLLPVVSFIYIDSMDLLHKMRRVSSNAVNTGQANNE